MFMTTKTHERLLADAIIKVQKDDVTYDLMACQNELYALQSLCVSQRTEIADMQHFYNKGRAVHNSDVRYEAKKRAAKIKVNAS